MVVMMKPQKRERIKLLYELERLVYKKKKTLEDRQRIKVIRETIDVDSPKTGRQETFDLNLYKKYRKKYPDATYDDLAKLLGIKPNSLYIARRRHGLTKSENGGAGA